MSLDFMEGFGAYDVYPYSPGSTLVTGTGGTGTKALQVSGTISTGIMSGGYTYFVGCSVNIDVLSCKLISFHAGSLTCGYITANVSGRIEIYVNDVVVGTCLTMFVRPRQWYHLEVRWTTNSSGYIQVRIDGITIMTLNGIDTGGILPTTVKWWGTNTYDDLYVLKSGLSPTDTYFGPSMIESSFPDNIGDQTEWQVTPEGTLNFNAVNNTNINKFVYATVQPGVSVQDLYQVRNLVRINGSIKAVSIIKKVHDIDAVNIRIGDKISYGGLHWESSGELISHEDGNYHRLILQNNPIDDSPWQIANYNLTQMGPYINVS